MPRTAVTTPMAYQHLPADQRKDLDRLVYALRNDDRLTHHAIASVLARYEEVYVTHHEVRSWLGRLGSPKNARKDSSSKARWSDAEIALALDHSLTAREVAEATGRTLNAVHLRRHKLAAEAR